jgi:hypothetical protein
MMPNPGQRSMVLGLRVLRILCRTAVLLFWLGTMGWFGYREIWPLLFPGNAPPFVIDLADEATSQGQVTWTMYHGDKEIGKSNTTLKYDNQNDTFLLISEVRDIELAELRIIGRWLYVANAKNYYVVTRKGELRAIHAEGELRVENKRRENRSTRGNFEYAASARFDGEVVDGKLVRSVVLHTPGGNVTPVLEPVDAPVGNILNPLHPISRIQGLKPGRRWRMTVIDPLADAVEPTLQAAWSKFNENAKPLNLKLPTGPKVLDVEVLSETAGFNFNGRDQECYIIEYRSSANEAAARTYVRVHDGLVLQQEAFAMGERFTLKR